MLNKELLIGHEVSIKNALRALNKTAMKVLFVVDSKQRLLGSLTDGDIRRALLRDIPIENSINGVFNEHPVLLYMGQYSEADIKNLFLKRHIELIPVVDKDNRVIDHVAWSDYFGEKKRDEYAGPPLDIPVVIMAGGKGTRLAPFTSVLPKPLIPIGEKTILEIIMGEFQRYGVDSFFFTLNYRGEMIRAYFSGLNEKYPIKYVWEDQFYGTAGSLALVASEIRGTFIVSNCDIIVKANYADVLTFHHKSKADMTIVSSLQQHEIPYGVIEFKAGGEVVKITEKPEYTYPINTGVYILEKDCIDLIPPRTVFHMTHLIDALLKAGKKVVTYPVGAHEYIDIGQWAEYREAVSLLSSSC